MDNTGKHILIVDDNLKNLQVTARILRDEKFRISLAQDGESALYQLGQQKPDLVLLDIMMPGIDGLEVCRKIKKNEKLKEIPIIFLTAMNQTEDLVEGFIVGGVDYITKPFKREELLIRVKNHLELAGSRKKIIEMNKNRDKLYSIIAHDIHSPLSNISMVVHAIEDGWISSGCDDFTEIIHDLGESTNSTLTLLENLLKWTNAQSDTISLSPKLMAVYPVIEECKQLLEGNACHKNITIELNIPDSVEAYFDEVTIHAVFRNLIANSIKFTPENGTIKICSSVNNGFVEITVKDNGIGMPENILNKIFKENIPHTSLGTNKEQGSGLGLLMVKDFVENNKGKLNVKSKPGEGTEIIVSLKSEKTKGCNEIS